MKLGLLLLLVAALLPYLSESRTVSKCELKEKLAAEINLCPKRMKHKDEILSIIVCEVNRTSGLDTARVNVDGIRNPMSTAEPTTEGTEPETMEVMTDAPTTPATTTTTTTTTTSSRKCLETLNDMENKFDEEEMAEDDERMSKEDSSDEENSPHLMPPNQEQLWSLGYYGIFQLRDSHFCDSGYRWSRNLCKKSCRDFTDDDITDDIQCFVNTNYFWYLFRSISTECYHAKETFLQDCP